MQMKKTILTILACYSLIACGHETKKAHAALEKDTKISDTEAIQKMAEASWIYTFDDSEKFTVTKKSNGKYSMVGLTTNKLGITSLDAESYLRIEMLQDAKFMWRLFRAAKSRGLEDIVYSRFITFTNGQKLELYRVRLTLADLESIAPTWLTADPYSVGEHDILDTEAAVAVEKKIPELWKVEVNNRDKVKIGGR